MPLFDIYDDQGKLIKEKFGDALSILKEADDISSFKNQLDDADFAFVKVGSAGKIRKFPVVDVGNLTASIIYFMENEDSYQFPKTAERLVEACTEFSIAPPLGLVKIAQGIVPSIRKEPLTSRKVTQHAVDDLAFNMKDISPPERRTLSKFITPQAEDVDVEVPEKMANYAGDDFNPELSMHLHRRKTLIKPEFEESLDLLESKKIELSPEDFAECLYEFDKMAGLTHYYDSKIEDPFAATITKKADASTNEDILHLAKNPEKLKQYFNAEFILEFQDNPVEIFKSLPSPLQKKLLA